MLRFLALILLMAATQAISQSGADNHQVSPEVVGIYESVIRYQIKSWNSAASTFCIEVDGRDADGALLKRLSPLPVKAASECERKSGRVWDRETKKTGVIFDIREIHRISDSEVEVMGGYWCGSQCMAEGVYYAVHEVSGWRVTSFDIKVIA